METDKKDIVEIMVLAEKIAEHTNRFETKIEEKTGEMEVRISAVEKEISDLKNA